MKPYGKERKQTCYRHIRGTSRDCPCCRTFAERHGKVAPGTRDAKKRVRRQGKQEASAEE